MADHGAVATMSLRHFWESDEAFARRLQAEEEARAHRGLPRQVLSDERLARLLQEQSPTTVAESPVVAQTDVNDDEELARLLQADEDREESSRHNPRRPLALSAPDRGNSSWSGWPMVLSILSSGACFGCCAGLQMAASFNCGQAALWICSLGGAVLGHMASNDTMPFHGHIQQQEPHTDSDSEDSYCRGVDLDVIEGHTIGHTFHGPPGAQKPQAGGNPEHMKCMVCMEEFSEGEALRSLPCLHRYHQRCIDQWLCRNAECPICKQNITAPQHVSSQSASETPAGGFSRLFRRRS